MKKKTEYKGLHALSDLYMRGTRKEEIFLPPCMESKEEDAVKKRNVDRSKKATNRMNEESPLLPS